MYLTSESNTFSQPVLQKIKASIARKKQRRAVKARTKKLFSQILDAPIRNEGTYCIHQIDPQNAGDQYAGPYHYFSSLQEKTSILQYLVPDSDQQNEFVNAITKSSLIVGGGGLFNRPAFQEVISLIESLSKKGKKIVIWGAGHNVATHKQRLPSNYNISFETISLVGTRDYSMPGEYVPCVSCLHPLLDRPYAAKQELGVVFHKRTMQKPEITKKLEGIPSLSNAATIEEIIPFIGESDALITDSYHAMYWGLLLAKKVTVIPNSSKFFDFHVKPLFSDFDHCVEHSSKAGFTTGLLEECRELNKHFYQKAMNIMSS